MNRSESCDPKTFGSKQDAPVSNVYYKCDSTGHLKLYECIYRGCTEVAEYNKQ